VYRDGVQLEVIGALLTHRSPSSTLIYMHPTRLAASYSHGWQIRSNRSVSSRR
jgi:hypothetical protein